MPTHADTKRTLVQLFDTLYERFGPQHWWPADSPTEVAIGAVLTQNTSWQNVERAITQLHAHGSLDFSQIIQMRHESLAEIIRPAGYFNTKASYLKNLAKFVVALPTGRLDDLRALDVADARQQLLNVKGIGPETADSILLYACEMPTFVVDAYTRRILLRHKLIDATATYNDIKAVFENALPRDVQLFNEYHALIVRLCKAYCRSTAECADCPWERHPHDALLK